MSVDEVDFQSEMEEATASTAKTEDSLVYPAWSNTVLSTLLDFFENAKHCDLILRFPPNPVSGRDRRDKESQILVHSAILHANTDYFLNKIQKDNRGHNCVILPQTLSPRTLLPIIYLFYTGKLTIDKAEVTWYEIRTAMLALKLKNGHNIVELLDYAKLNKAGFSAKGGAMKSAAPKKRAYAEAVIRAKLKSSFLSPSAAPGVRPVKQPNKTPKRTLFQLDETTNYIMELAPGAKITNHRSVIHKILKENRNLMKPNTAVKLQIKVLKPFGSTGAGNTRMETVTIKTTQNENGRLVVELNPEKVPGDEKLPDPDDPLSKFVLKRRMDPSKFVYTGKPGRPRRIKKKRRVLPPKDQPPATFTTTDAENVATEAFAEAGGGANDPTDDPGEPGDVEMEGTGNLDLDAVLAESGVKIEVVASGTDKAGEGASEGAVDEDWENEADDDGVDEGPPATSDIKQEMMEKN